jgi:hypothetical protein
VTKITVEPAGGDTYRVTVTETRSLTTHDVTVSPADVDRLGSGGTPEKLIEASFRFLLDRESKESILRRFDLSLISRYFPEYPSRIADYL